MQFYTKLLSQSDKSDPDENAAAHRRFTVGAGAVPSRSAEGDVYKRIDWSTRQWASDSNSMAGFSSRKACLQATRALFVKQHLHSVYCKVTPATGGGPFVGWCRAGRAEGLLSVWQ